MKINLISTHYLNKLPLDLAIVILTHNYNSIVSAPSRLKLVERAKYDVWKKLGNSMTKEEAKKKFIELFKLKNPAASAKL
jgi:hypothetical protein